MQSYTEKTTSNDQIPYLSSGSLKMVSNAVPGRLGETKEL